MRAEGHRNVLAFRDPVMLSEAKHLWLVRRVAWENHLRFFAEPVLSEAEGLRMTTLLLRMLR
jgi:hypothetical protein